MKRDLTLVVLALTSLAASGVMAGPTQFVPEPDSLALLGVAAVAAVVIALRHRGK